MAKRGKRWKVSNSVVFGIGVCVLVAVIVLVYFVFFRAKENVIVQGITYENFQQLEIGMAKTEVFEVLGEQNCIISGYTTEEEMHIVSYSCANSDGSNIQLMFKNDKLEDKTQFGLEL